MISIFNKIGIGIEKISKFAGWISGAFIFIMIPLITYEVFMRYVLNKPPMISDQFSAYLLVGCVFLGLAYTMKEEGHIRVQAIVSRLNIKTANWLRLFTLIVSLVVVATLIHSSIQFVHEAYKLGLKSETVWLIPEYIPKLLLPLGFVVFFMQIMVNVGKASKSLHRSK